VKRTATVTTVAAVVLATLTACSSSDSSDTKSAPTPSPSTSTAAVIDSGMPPKPTGQTRTDLLAALRQVNPELVVDEEKALSNARNQCSSINGKSPKVDWAAQQRFGTSKREVSDAEAKQINAALAEYCATA